MPRQPTSRELLEQRIRNTTVEQDIESARLPASGRGIPPEVMQAAQVPQTEILQVGDVDLSQAPRQGAPFRRTGVSAEEARAAITGSRPTAAPIDASIFRGSGVPALPSDIEARRQEFREKAAATMAGGSKEARARFREEKFEAPRREAAAEQKAADKAELEHKRAVELAGVAPKIQAGAATGVAEIGAGAKTDVAKIATGSQERIAALNTGSAESIASEERKSRERQNDKTLSSQERRQAGINATALSRTREQIKSDETIQGLDIAAKAKLTNQIHDNNLKAMAAEFEGKGDLQSAAATNAERLASLQGRIQRKAIAAQGSEVLSQIEAGGAQDRLTTTARGAVEEALIRARGEETRLTQEDQQSFDLASQTQAETAALDLLAARYEEEGNLQDAQAVRQIQNTMLKSTLDRLSIAESGAQDRLTQEEAATHRRGDIRAAGAEDRFSGAQSESLGALRDEMARAAERNDTAAVEAISAEIARVSGSVRDPSRALQGDINDDGQLSGDEQRLESITQGLKSKNITQAEREVLQKERTAVRARLGL